MSVSGRARSIKRISLKRFHSMRQYKCRSRKVCPGRRCGPPSQQSEIGWFLAAGQTVAPKDTSMYLFVSKRRKIYQKESKAGAVVKNVLWSDWIFILATVSLCNWRPWFSTKSMSFSSKKICHWTSLHCFFCLFSSTYSNSLNESDGKFSIFKTNSVWPVRAELLVHSEEEVRECHYFVALNCKFCSDLALVHLQFSYLCSIFRYGGLLSDNKQRRLGQAKVIQ